MKKKQSKKKNLNKRKKKLSEKFVFDNIEKKPNKPIEYHIYNFKNFLFTKYNITEINDKLNFDPLNISFH